MAYRIIRELMVLAVRDNHQAAVSLPAGTIIDVVGPARDDRFLRVHVGGEEFEVFQTDVEDSCDRLDPEHQAAWKPARVKEIGR